jgi:hypothetical protein
MPKEYSETGHDCIVTCCMNSTPTKYYSGDQVKKDERGGASGTNGEQERYTQGFGVKTSGKRTTAKT